MTRSGLLRTALAAVTILASAKLGHAGMVTTADGLGADARVTRGSPTANFGASDFVAIQNRVTAPANARKTYLRFDLSSLGALPFAAAELQLTPSADFSVGSGVTFDLFGLNDLNTGESWGESTITWNNAPANDTGSNSGVLSGATSLGSFLFTADFVEGTPISFASTSIRDFLNADTNDLATFILTRPSPSPTNFTFGSSENTEGLQFPTLNATAVPEPSTPVMLGVLLSCLGAGYALRKRRDSAKV